ncbi:MULTISPECIES: hypothetical protein [unclassified Nocardioides]|jgi:hypothetical protein|nr:MULTISPECIES: hypothetical protein [unclassified Nocardioides]
MSTALFVVVAAVLLFVLLVGALFGVVWFAGKNGRKAQLRG